MLVNYRKPKGLAPTLEALQGEVGRQGFDHLEVIYKERKSDAAAFESDNTQMFASADELIVSGHFPEAIDVLKLNGEITPDASNGYTLLGDAYVCAGQNDLAIKSYKNS